MKIPDIVVDKRVFGWYTYFCSPIVVGDKLRRYKLCVVIIELKGDALPQKSVRRRSGRFNW